MGQRCRNANLREPAYKGETIVWRWQSKGKGKRAVAKRASEEHIRLPEGTTPAIVSIACWQAVQSRLDQNTGEALRNESRPYLLRGKIFCSICGRRMRSSPEHQQRVYRCSSRETAAGPCGGKRVSAEQCEVWVWSTVAEKVKNPRLIEEELQRVQKAGPDADLDEKLKIAEAEYRAIEATQERLLNQFSNDSSEGLMKFCTKTWLAERKRSNSSRRELIL